MSSIEQGSVEPCAAITERKRTFRSLFPTSTQHSAVPRISGERFLAGMCNEATDLDSEAVLLSCNKQYKQG